MKIVDEMLAQAEHYLNQIDNLSKQQKQLVRAADFDGLNLLLEQKSSLIQELTQLSKKIKKNSADEVSKKEKQQNNPIAKIADIANTAKNIVKMDQKDLHTAMINRDKTYKMLLKITQGRKLIHRYRQKGSQRNHSKQWNG